jgi:hypothetical protein
LLARNPRMMYSVVDGLEKGIEAKAWRRFADEEKKNV